MAPLLKDWICPDICSIRLSDCFINQTLGEGRDGTLCLHHLYRQINRYILCIAYQSSVKKTDYNYITSFTKVLWPEKKTFGKIKMAWRTFNHLYFHHHSLLVYRGYAKPWIYTQCMQNWYHNKAGVNLNSYCSVTYCSSNLLDCQMH